MHIGISRPPTPPQGYPDVDGALVAQYAEQCGFESVFYGEHPIRPVSGPSFHVHNNGVPHFQDLMVMLARASALTSTITLGAGAFLIPEHHPIRLARELASLDLYSGGRIICGATTGWSRPEIEALGGNYDRRWAQTIESLGIMRRLWTEQTVEHSGEFYSFPPMQLYPGPAQPRGPKYLLGARLTDRSVERIARHADGWLAVLFTDENIAQAPELAREARQRLDDAAERIGRDPRELQITMILRGPQHDGDLTPRTFPNRDLLRRLEDAGADRALIALSTLRDESDIERVVSAVAESALPS
ncbi:TIGR03619 family F420-dependent LLM class oxidoreductase [Microbacterium soli]|uniref:LLM class F420-dependent oxidoreductase n=1 Tax=Microbacterium soli TaxID=446075 RepID=A0ABP7MKF7_9MICO